MQKLYSEMYQTELKIEVGLECGFLNVELEEIDMISMVPNIYDVHTPN